MAKYLSIFHPFKSPSTPFMSSPDPAPQLEATLSFNFSHTPGNQNCNLTIRVEVRNLSTTTPSTNTIATLWLGPHPIDLIPQGQTIHFDEPFKTHRSYEFPIPEIDKPRLHTYRLSFGSDLSPFKDSSYITTITCVHGELESGEANYQSPECSFECKVVHENKLLHRI
jgi:hypothetical protein